MEFEKTQKSIISIEEERQLELPIYRRQFLTY